MTVAGKLKGTGIFNNLISGYPNGPAFDQNRKRNNLLLNTIRKTRLKSSGMITTFRFQSEVNSSSGCHPKVTFGPGRPGKGLVPELFLLNPLAPEPDPCGISTTGVVTGSAPD